MYKPLLVQRMINRLRKYFTRIYWALAWTIIIFVLLTLPGSVLPNESSFVIPNFDKLVHIGMFGGFVLLWSLYYSARSSSPKKLLRIFFVIFLISISYGISMEYVQKYFIPQRYFDEGDIIADIIGSGLAYGISNILLS
jgi:VanZ family protein